MTTNNNFNIFTTTSRGKLEPGVRRHDASAVLDDSDQRLAEALADGQQYRPRWQRHAACRGVDTTVFFPVRGESAEQAKNICDDCIVLDECKTWGLDQPDHGVIAGLSAKQRRAARARRARSAV